MIYNQIAIAKGRSKLKPKLDIKYFPFLFVTVILPSSLAVLVVIVSLTLFLNANRYAIKFDRSMM